MRIAVHARSSATRRIGCAKTPSTTRTKTTMRVVGARSSADSPEALAARLAAELAPEVAPTRSISAVVVASPCSVKAITQHLIEELQLDAVVGFGSNRESFSRPKACDSANPYAAVTLLSMPAGATATAFVSDAGCLPALDDWERFVQAPPSLLLFAAAGSPRERALLDEWLRRVDGALPESPKVGGVVNDDGPVVAGGRGQPLQEGAVAGLALDGGVDSLVGLHVVVAPGSRPLTQDHSLVTASLPMPRGDRVLVTGVDGRRVRKSALGLEEDDRDTIVAELTNGTDGRTCPVEVEHGSLAVCCCPQTIVPGHTTLRLRAVGDRDARERAVLASVAPARRAHGDSAILEFSGISCAPGEPSLVAEALGANALGATFRAAIAPGPTSCRTVVHDQATVLAYVAPGV